MIIVILVYQIHKTFIYTVEQNFADTRLEKCIKNKCSRPTVKNVETIIITIIGFFFHFQLLNNLYSLCLDKNHTEQSRSS